MTSMVDLGPFDMPEGTKAAIERFASAARRDGFGGHHLYLAVHPDGSYTARDFAAYDGGGERTAMAHVTADSPEWRSYGFEEDGEGADG